MNQQQYKKETRIETVNGKTYTVTHLTPILTPEEYEARKREIERRLYEIYSKYDVKDRKAA